MVFTFNDFINESKLNRMSFSIPSEDEWVEDGEKLGIEFLGKVYWILDKDLEFMMTNIGKVISFRYNEFNNIIWPTLM